MPDTLFAKSHYDRIHPLYGIVKGTNQYRNIDTRGIACDVDFWFVKSLCDNILL